MSEKKLSIIIDTDPGDDDATSIMWAIASNKFDIKALTISNGNVGVDKCVINALRVLEICKRTDIPVYKGAYRPMVRPSIEAEWIHGKDGLGDQGFPMPKIDHAIGYAPAEMVRIAKESTEPITILCLGPLTNIAIAILIDPDFEKNVKQVLFMGGAVTVSGNQSPRASFNVKVDPEAAKVVYNSSIDVVQIGLDVCNQVTQKVSDLDEIGESKTDASEFLLKVLDFRRNKAVRIIKDEKGNEVNRVSPADEVESGKESDRKQGIGLNDLTTTGYLINPSWFKTKYATMDVETTGLCDGETIVDFYGLWGREKNGYFAYEVDEKSLVAQWVEDMKKFNP